MRRKFLSAALVALSIAMAACGNDGDGEAVAPEPGNGTQLPSDQPSEPKQEKTLMTFKASYAGDDAISKTAIANTKDLLFSAGDRIVVWDGTGFDVFTSDIETGNSATCNFTGYSYQSGTYHAIYPSSASINAEQANADIPTLQTPVAGSFDPKAHVMVASTESDNFKFKTANAFLRFTAPCDLKSVEVVGENIAGDIVITPNGEYSDFTIAPGASKSNSVSMTGDIKSGSEYYIAVAPGTYADGITIKMVSADNKYGEYTTSTGLEIRPNSLRTFSKLSTVEFNMLSKNMSYVLSKCSESETQTIELADYEWKTVRTALLNNLSKKVYLKLPENGMTSIPDYAFYDYRSSNLTNLVNIDIPKTVTHIGQEAFHNCEKLVHANLPSGLNYIGPYSFMYCEKLVLEEIPSSVTEIRSYAFLGCKSLQNLTINSSPTFGSDVFLGCSPSLKVNVNDETYLKYGDEGKPYHNVMVDPRPDAPGAKVSVEGTSNGSDIN